MISAPDAPHSTIATGHTVLFYIRPQSEARPHHGRSFSIYLCSLSFWLTLPRGVLSTSWCCPSRPCVAFLACVQLFLALSLSPGNSLVSSWCDHSMLASLLWLRETVPSQCSYSLKITATISQLLLPAVSKQWGVDIHIQNETKQHNSNTHSFCEMTVSFLISIRFSSVFCRR